MEGFMGENVRRNEAFLIYNIDLFGEMVGFSKNFSLQRWT